MEALLGRPLRSGEIVHHRDENTLNNEPGNLELMTAGAHVAMHHRISTWTKQHMACRECGTTDRKHLGGGLCSLCYQRQPGKRWKDWKVRHAVRIR